jgi:S1-C subfamily serine protease
MRKKIIKFFAICIVFFLVGGISSVISEHYIFPKLSTNSFFSKIGFLKKLNENVTVINKTEEITVKEDTSVNKVASQAASSVVNILSISKNSPSNLAKKLSAKEIQKSGTGVIVTNDGMIITYRTAIIENNAEYQVLLFNGSVSPAKLVAIDEFTNLAYLKTEATNLPAISFSNSLDLFPGKKVIAIGNSFGEYQNSYASGLLSKINKVFNISGETLSTSGKMEGILETDFSDIADYVGGPVIDYGGELVGIIGSVVIDNKPKYFEIPSNFVKDSLELAVNDGLKNRPDFGAYYVPITKAYSIINNLPKDRGALIFSASGKQGLAVIAGSPAEKAGIKINDIIMRVNDQEINLDNSLSNTINRFKKGDEIKILVLRDGKEMEISVKL